MRSDKTGLNPTVYDEYQSQSANVLTLPREQAHQDVSINTPQPTFEFQVRLSLLLIRMNLEKPLNPQ